MPKAVLLTTFVSIASVLTAAGTNADAPVRLLDPGQADTAIRLVQEGDNVRIFCKPCTEVVYDEVQVRSRRLRQAGQRQQFVLNGEAVDVSIVYIQEVGEVLRWTNLAALLGEITDRPETLSRGARPASRLENHLGYFAGSVGDTTAVLELHLDRRRLRGFWRPNNDSDEIHDLRGTTFNSTSDGDTVSLRELFAGRSTAILSGQFQEGRLTGERAPLLGDDAEPLELERLAEYVQVHEQSAHVQARALYPVFQPGKTLSDLSILIANRARGGVQSFLEEWNDEKPMDGRLFRFESLMTVVRYQPDFLVVREELRRDTGGALEDVTTSHLALKLVDGQWQETAVPPEVLGSRP